MKNKSVKLKGILSIEQLHHFRCGACDKWWSIGDPSITKPGSGSATEREWFCPWCGQKNVF